MSCGCLRCSKGLKICCGVTAILLIVLVVILVILIFTVFKPKDPTITLASVTIERFHVVVFPTVELNASLGIVVTVDNPNHGSFRYQNSTAYLNYRGNLLAEAPLNEDTIPARETHNISTSLNVFADVTKIPDLVTDYLSGTINLTSTTTLPGKVKILNLFKIKATSYSTCDLSVFLHDNSVNSTCNIQLKF